MPKAASSQRNSRFKSKQGCRNLLAEALPLSLMYLVMLGTWHKESKMWGGKCIYWAITDYFKKWTEKYEANSGGCWRRVGTFYNA